MAKEMRVDNLILRLDDRVVEVFATDSTFNTRIHVDAFGVMAKGPDRNGEVKVRFGVLWEGKDMFLGGHNGMTLDAQDWIRFQAFHADVKAVRAVRPETW